MLTMFGFGVPSMTMDVNNGFGHFTRTSRASLRCCSVSMSWKSPWESHRSMATALTIAPFWTSHPCALTHFPFSIYLSLNEPHGANPSFLCQTKQNKLDRLLIHLETNCFLLHSFFLFVEWSKPITRKKKWCKIASESKEDEENNNWMWREWSGQSKIAIITSLIRLYYSEISYFLHYYFSSLSRSLALRALFYPSLRSLNELSEVKETRKKCRSMGNFQNVNATS